MDPLHFLESEELLRFLHCQKTELSCMEKPHTFLSQLRDHNLIPEDRYQKMSRMKSKENLKKALYEVLDWLERKQSQHIMQFWSCVLVDTLMNQYPTLRLLRNSLMDGSYRLYTQLPEMVEKEEAHEKRKKELSEKKEEETDTSGKKKRKRQKSVCDEEEQQPGPSSQSTPNDSPLKKSDKNDIWTWPLYKLLLPVKCGSRDATLNRDKMTQGEKCIFCHKQWFSPSEFEKFAGKESSRNWKMSIKCRGTPLGKLIKEGHLQSADFKTRRTTESKRAKRLHFSSDDSEPEGGEESEDEEDDDPEDLVSSSNKEGSSDVTDEDGESEEQTKVFKVTCGVLAGTLHQKRFGSGTRGKSIRTEKEWLSPEEFLKNASCQADATWRKDIMSEGRPLGDLVQENILKIHSLLCKCTQCKPNPQHIEDQKNDDECFVCKMAKSNLVVCDSCPRSFHEECHLPHVEEAVLVDPRPWLCTFCVAKQTWLFSGQLEMKEALSRQTSRHLLECHYLLLSLYGADEKQTFSFNPSLYIENYSIVIRTPMWLGEIKNKLQSNKYTTVGDFVADVELLFTNCARYNQANPEFLVLGEQLNESFKVEFKRMFNICEHSVE